MDVLLFAALALADFRHVTFEGLAPTVYKETDGAVTAKVARSSSFLLQAFPAPRAVRKVTFTWKADGRPAVKDAAHEASKGGDDAVLRVGLLLAGDAPLVPFFAPAWVKAVRDALKHPTDEMLYLVADARHKAGERWPSPYSGSIVSLATSDSDAAHGFRKSEAALPEAVKVVGLWIMADGDDTGSAFDVTIRDVALE